jgi:N-acetylmuramoyl-L-alanine amidase
MVRATGSRLALVGAALVAGLTAAAAAERRLSGPAAAEFPVATDARLGGDESRTRFVVDLTKAVDLRVFTLADPYRVVIDLPQVAFHLPPRAGETGRGLVKGFRFGLVMPGGSRIVLEATGPVAIDKSFVLEPKDDQPARMVVDLVPVDRETFLQNLAVQRRPQPAPEARRSERDQRRPADPRPLVMLDPGHGGIDKGTSAPTGETEKAVVLEFALLLRDRLERTGRYRVAMTRADDRFVSLAERVAMARAQQAALFISIHADAVPRREGEARGATVYTLSETASDAEAARLAEAENKADAIAGVDLGAEPSDIADILIDLAQRETKAFSVQFARTLVGELRNAARLHKHPLKSAGFRVLTAPDVPSVLVELGYMSNPQDLKLLMSEAWRARAVDAIVQAVQAFFAMRLAGAQAFDGP